MQLSIKALRINKGLTRDEVAAALGMSYGAYARMEKSNGKGMKVETLARICNLYNVQMDDISINEEEKNG